ncbi:MAG: PAS domain S-box protein [Anaerolineae bacterium]|nr:PAS domain S-box protein [Anaerolineae bacterium]
MHDPGPELSGFLDYVYLVLQQFAGGPGLVENNLMRFGVPAVCLAGLFLIAWSRQRETHSRRERWLLLGFGLGFLRESLMFLHVSSRLMHGGGPDSATFLKAEPLEHALAMLAVGVIAGSFIGYLLQNRRLAVRYIGVVVVAAIISYAVTTRWWTQYLITHPGVTFHETWPAWLFHTGSVLLICGAIVILWQARGWLRNTVVLAMLCFLISEAIMILNIATNKAYATYACPIGNTFHILAMPLLGFVYLREQSLEKRRVDAELQTYRENLEGLVSVRTRELTLTNRRLTQEIVEREKAETALARLSRHHALILESAGEGIFGVDLEGRHTFVNRAAADMLGYKLSELIGKPSHATWHHSYADGTPYPESACPLHTGYKTGMVTEGDDQIFWRKDGTAFPARYISTPIFEGGKLTGAVVVFQDISERKQAELEIIRQNAELATQNAIAATVSQSLELDVLLSTALKTVLSALDVDAGCIFLCSGAKSALELELHLAHGCEAQALPSQCLEVAKAAVETMAPAVQAISRRSNDDDQTQSAPSSEEMIGIPLTVKGRALGAMSLLTRGNGHGPFRDLSMLTAIGQQIGIALENARLYQEAENAAALEERQCIAADVHDGLAQTISYIGHQIDTMMGQIDNGNSAQALAVGEDIRETLDGTSTELRRLISSLQAKPEPPKSLQSLIDETIVASRLAAETPLVFRTTMSDPYYVTPDERQQIERILQEAIVNAQRHAQAGEIVISLTTYDGTLAMTVADDGCGFLPDATASSPEGHFGLSIMRARAARLAGSLDVTSQPRKGTQIILRWPRSSTASPPTAPAVAPQGDNPGARPHDNNQRSTP